MIGLGFLSCHTPSTEDLLVPRIAYVRCYGLPLKLWCNVNFASLIKDIGELMGITPFLNSDCVFINPVLKISTLQYDEINYKKEVCFEDKVNKFYFKEEVSSFHDWNFIDAVSEESNQEEEDLIGNINANNHYLDDNEPGEDDQASEKLEDDQTT